MRLLLGTFVITYNLEHVLLLAACWATLAWFELSPHDSRLDRNGGPGSLKTHLHLDGMQHDGATSWSYVVTQGVLGFLVGVLARYLMKRTYPWSHFLGSPRLHDGWVISSLIVVALVVLVGLFGYENEVKLHAREDSELFPIGRIHALLVGVAIYAILYTRHMQWLHWNFFNSSNASSSSSASQREALHNDEKQLGLWLLAQGSIYASLIVLDILLVQSVGLSLRLLALLVVFLVAMFVFKKAALLW